MANGSPQSTATQTSLLKYDKTLPSSWFEYSKFEEPTYSRVADTTKTESKTKTPSTEALPRLSGVTVNEVGVRIPRTDNHGQGQITLEDESGSMRDSPAESCNGSATHDRTPRIRPADPNRSSSPFRGLSNNATSPNRQDSAYESIRGCQNEEPKVDVDIQARNIRARERVEILRGRVLRTRRIMNERRQDVQDRREKLRDATAKFMTAIDELMARDNGHRLRSLGPFYEATRVAQDELGPFEDQYDILEIRLSREEEELEQEEMYFYTHNNIILAPLPDYKLDEPLTPLLPPYHPDSVEFQGLDLENEVVKQFLEKMAEAEHLKEEIDELESEQYSLTEELTFRTRYKLKLSEEKSAFMFDYPQVYKELTGKLQRVEDDLYELRDRCVDQGLFSASEHVYEPRDALVEEIYDSMNDAMDRLPLRTAVDHNSSYRPHVPNYSDKRDYVNTWLLEWVQDSPVEAVRLRTFIVLEFEKDGKELEGGVWPTLALGWWDKDHAGEEANEKHVLSTMDALLGGSSNSRDSEGSLDVDLGDGERVEIEIMGSETGSYRTQKGDQETRRSNEERPGNARLEQGLNVRSRTSSGSRAVSI